MKRPLPAVLFLAVLCSAPSVLMYAEERAAESTADNSGGRAAPVSRFSTGASYFGEMITHPGFSVNLEYALYTGATYKLILAGRTGWYIHIRSHQAIFLEPGIIHRLTAPSGFFADALLGAGYFLRSPDGVVYETGGSGNAVPGNASWHSKLSLSAYLGCGWDFGRRGPVPVSIFIRAGVLGEYPFNGYILPHAVLETGFRSAW